MNEDSVIVIDRQQSAQKGKGSLAVILAIAFVALLGIGSTFAYLSWTANQASNRASMGGLTADLLEPSYTNAAVTDNGGTIAKNGTVTKTNLKPTYVASDGKLIPKGAWNMTPSSEYSKNPFVVNTSSSDTVYGFAGLKVQFQKWERNAKGDAEDNTNDANWINMTATEVDDLLKVYSISSDPNSTTPGLQISKATKKYNADKSSTTATTSADAGYTANKWVQLYDSSANDGGTYGVKAAGKSNSTGAMYFVNYSRLVSMNNSIATDNAIAKNVAGTEDGTSSTWGYKADDTATTSTSAPSSTSPLFQYVRFLNKASATDVDTFLNDLDKDASGNVVDLNYKSGTSGPRVTFTSGWRMVISAAIIQSADASDVNGVDTSSGKVGTAVADSLMKGSTTAVNTSSYWYQNFKTILDKAGTGTSDADGKINRNMSAKPKAATGIREDKSAQGTWYTINSAGTGVDEHTGTGVGEPTSIGKATGDAADIDHS